MARNNSRNWRKGVIKNKKRAEAQALPISNGVDITRTIRGTVPSIPFEDIAREILSERYVLSLVLCGDALARRINRAYRKKTYAANVLSFPLAEYEGEIFLNIRKAQREAVALKIPARTRIAHLFTHGCFHLKGLRHGSTMDALEEKALEKSGF